MDKKALSTEAVALIILIVTLILLAFGVIASRADDFQQILGL